MTSSEFAPAAQAFESLCHTMARLRRPNGCPWDAEQTHQTLRPYLVEESAEVLEALDLGDMRDLKEELGDLLLQVMFHSEIASEAASEDEAFGIEEVVRGIDQKLVRRHPHVFEGKAVPETREAASEQWAEIKAAEKAARGHQLIPESVLDDVPSTLPALARTQKVSKKAAKVGFDWKDADEVLAKVDEEMQELREATTPEERDEEFGDLLLAWVNWARHQGIDAEGSLARATTKFERRFRHMETIAKEKGLPHRTLDAEAWDKLWNEAKAAIDQSD